MFKRCSWIIANYSYSYMIAVAIAIAIALYLTGVSNTPALLNSTMAFFAGPYSRIVYRKNTDV